MPLSDELKKLSDELEILESEAYDIIQREVFALKADLETVSPVDTGYFRSSWRIEKVGLVNFRIHNSAEYATILANGRRFVDGKMYGSLQWEGGLDPMLEATNNSIDRKLKRIKR